jgi:hypothetical protein
MKPSAAADSVLLTDHAFTAKVRTDPDFRQALVLDPSAALSYYRISARIENKMRAMLELLDHLLPVLTQHWVRDESLRQAIGDAEARRVLLFAPRESASAFELSPDAGAELMRVSALAETLFEALLAEWST